MRIAFMGSGGLGGYFGARLCKGGADVHFIARGAHLEVMRSDGLRVEGPEPMHVPTVRATDNPEEIGVADFVMVCVKLWDTEEALKRIAPMVGPRTTLISFQIAVASTSIRLAAPSRPTICAPSSLPLRFSASSFTRIGWAPGK